MRSGSLLTLVTWGNCIELVEETLAAMDTELDVELIDLRSIVPWDRDCVATSLRKTGRLMVVQEDNVSASVGQMLIAEMCSDATLLQGLKSPPVLVSKADVHVGFNPIYEYAALPDAERVAAALNQLLATSLPAAIQLDATPMGHPIVASHSTSTMPDTTPVTPGAAKNVTVPILGEGIRVARVVSILKQAGDAVKADDALCEVETDKAVFPIECDEDGRLEEWLVAEDDEVAVGQDLARLKVQSVQSAAVPQKVVSAAPAYDSMKQSAGLSQEAIRQIEGIVPATIEMTCRWEVVRDARLRSKQLGGATLSTAAMTAWAVVQAMGRHERFTSYLRAGQLVHDAERFDLGVAVARPGDVLETAVVKSANSLEWSEFPDVFNQALRDTRHGVTVSKNRVSLTISSMGAYAVRSAIPVVVPPSVATLFIGAPYVLPDPGAGEGATQEVVSLVLTFDHRWVNGVGAAAFLTDVRKGIERFKAD